MKELTSSERRLLSALNTPTKIQTYLDGLSYHVGNTAWSPRMVLRNQKAHCLEGAVLAAAALRVNGIAPLILDFEAVNDTDHVIAVFRKNGAWGGIGMSNVPGCRYRDPVHRSLRELAISYFNDYFNDRRERTMRTYSRPVNLTRFDHLHWMTSEKSIWFVGEYLAEIPHTRLLSPAMERELTRIDERSFRASSFGRVKKA